MKLDELYDRYGEQMYRYLALRLGSVEDARDVLQETFCRLARCAIRRAIVRNPGAFAFRVLRNEANRHLRKLVDRRTGDLAARDRSGSEASLFTGPDDNTILLVSRALAGLPDEQREVVILKVYQDFSFKEIGRLCGVSINTAASRYRYGIEKMRASLGDGS
jgi:RNA polymerase sigma-70 factor (ECF subfamily)